MKKPQEDLYGIEGRRWDSYTKQASDRDRTVVEILEAVLKRPLSEPFIVVSPKQLADLHKIAETDKKEYTHNGHRDNSQRQ